MKDRSTDERLQQSTSYKL